MIDASTREPASLFPSNIDTEQARGAGMAMTLIALLCGYLLHYRHLYLLSMVLLVIDMIAPNVYKPIARVWFGLARILGTLVSKILLTLVFVLLVIPVGLIRSWSGKDPLQLKPFKRGAASVFTVREHTFQAEDLIRPY